MEVLFGSNYMHEFIFSPIVILYIVNFLFVGNEIFHANRFSCRYWLYEIVTSLPSLKVRLNYMHWLILIKIICHFHAEIISRNKDVCLHFLSFVDIEMV